MDSCKNYAYMQLFNLFVSELYLSLKMLVVYTVFFIYDNKSRQTLQNVCNNGILKNQPLINWHKVVLSQYVLLECYMSYRGDICQIKPTETVSSTTIVAGTVMSTIWNNALTLMVSLLITHTCVWEISTDKHTFHTNRNTFYWTTKQLNNSVPWLFILHVTYILWTRQLNAKQKDSSTDFDELLTSWIVHVTKCSL